MLIVLIRIWFCGMTTSGIEEETNRTKSRHICS